MVRTTTTSELVGAILRPVRRALPGVARKMGVELREAREDDPVGPNAEAVEATGASTEGGAKVPTTLEAPLTSLGVPTEAPRGLSNQGGSRGPTHLEASPTSLGVPTVTPRGLSNLGGAEVPTTLDAPLTSLGVPTAAPRSLSNQGGTKVPATLEMPLGNSVDLAEVPWDDASQVGEELALERPVFRVARRSVPTQAEVQSTAPASEEAVPVLAIPRMTFSMRRGPAAKVPTTFETATSGPLGRFVNLPPTGLDADVPPTFDQVPQGLAGLDADVPPTFDVPPTLEQVSLLGRPMIRPNAGLDAEVPPTFVPAPPRLTRMDSDVPPTLEQPLPMERVAKRPNGEPKVPTTSVQLHVPVESRSEPEFSGVGGGAPLSEPPKGASLGGTTRAGKPGLDRDSLPAPKVPTTSENSSFPNPRRLVFAERVTQATAPVWNEAHRITHDALTVERADISAAAPPTPNAVTNTFNVNVHVGPDGASTSQDREALEQTLCDILRDAARRHGLEV